MQIEASRFDNLKIFFPCISILFRRRLSQIVLYKLFNNIFRANKRTITIFVYLKNVYEICQFRDSFFSWGYESFSPFSFPHSISHKTKLLSIPHPAFNFILLIGIQWPSKPKNNKTNRCIPSCEFEQKPHLITTWNTLWLGQTVIYQCKGLFVLWLILWHIYSQLWVSQILSCFDLRQY